MGIKIRKDGEMYAFSPSVKRLMFYAKCCKTMWHKNKVKKGPGILLHWCKVLAFDFLFEDDWDI